MLRILSILLVIAGLVVAGLGGAALLEEYAPKEVSSAAAPAPNSVEVAAAEDMAIETASVESAPMDEAAMAEPEAATSEAAPAPPALAKSAERAEESEAIAGTESAMPEADTGFMFQTQSVEDPAAMMPPPEQRTSSEPAEVSAAVSPPAPKSSFEDRLQTVPVAHETPRSAEYKRAFDVTFAIDATGDTTAADALPGRGVIEEGEAKVSDRVEVRLSGASFNIVAASPPVQSLSPLTENTWRWSVTPMTAGEHDLVFEVFAIDSDAVTPLRTFQDTVTVNVSGINRAIAFADQANPLFVLLGGLGSAIAGLFGAIRFFGKR